MKFFSRKQIDRPTSKSQTRKWHLGLATAFSLLAVTGQLPGLDSAFSELLPVEVSPTQALAQSNTQATWATLEQDLVAEHNRIRQNPQSYIPLLEARLASMDRNGNIPNGCGRNCTMLTNEGQSAVQEAIQYLRNQPPVGPLALSSGVAQAAKAHASDQRGGSIGHRGSDGSSVMDRVNRFGSGHTGVGENISYGPSTAQDVMISLIVDDGVPSRGHRTNIFRDRWDTAGAGCGPHATYRTVCVINYTSTAR